MSSKYFSIKEHIIPGQYIREYPGATLDSQEDVLKLHIKQYTPLEGEATPAKGITFIGAHANGFPKELYEPLWDELHVQAKDSRISIGSIWIADVTQEGHSSVLNEDKLGNDPSWKDHPRDLLQMINHFRDQMPRPLVGIGHSMGGNILVNLSTMHPRLLSTLVLIDPVMQLNPLAVTKPGAANYGRLSAFRRDLWPSRSVAAGAFSKSPFYKSWDPRVLSLWNEFALRELPTLTYPKSSNDRPDTSKPPSNPASKPKPTEQPVTLTTPKHQEVFTFLRPAFPTPGHPVMNRTTLPDVDFSLPREFTYPFYRPEPASTFRRLPQLRPSVCYIFGGASEISRPEWCREKMATTGVGVGGSGGAKEGKVKEVVLEGVGHLIPMLVPKLCAEKAIGWLLPELQRWWEEEEKWTREWKAVGRRERQILSDEHRRMLGGDPRAKGTLEKL